MRRLITSGALQQRHGSAYCQRMVKELARRWGEFSISEEEDVGVDAIEGVTEVLESKGQSYLVGKLITERIIGKESIRSTLIRG